MEFVVTSRSFTTSFKGIWGKDISIDSHQNIYQRYGHLKICFSRKEKKESILPNTITSGVPRQSVKII